MGNGQARDSQATALEPPQPLRRKVPPGEPFPTEALTGLLGEMVHAVAERTRAPEALCAQSVLATTALVVQAHGDVELPTGAIGRAPSISVRLRSQASARRAPTTGRQGPSRITRGNSKLPTKKIFLDTRDAKPPGKASAIRFSGIRTTKISPLRSARSRCSGPLRRRRSITC